jgi:acyl carrier protein
VHSECEGDKPLLKAEDLNISRRLLSDGFLSKDTFESLLEKWYRMLQQPDHAIFRQLFVISGTKKAHSAKPDDSVRRTEISRSERPSSNLNDLAEVSLAEQERKLGVFFTNTVKAILEQPDMEVEVDTRLRDIAIDSIAAAELSFIAESTFDTDVSISDILQKLSIKDIINLVLSNLNAGSSDKCQRPPAGG